MSQQNRTSVDVSIATIDTFMSNIGLTMEERQKYIADRLVIDAFLPKDAHVLEIGSRPSVSMFIELRKAPYAKHIVVDNDVGDRERLNELIVLNKCKLQIMPIEDFVDIYSYNAVVIEESEGDTAELLSDLPLEKIDIIITSEMARNKKSKAAVKKLMAANTFVPTQTIVENKDTEMEREVDVYVRPKEAEVDENKTDNVVSTEVNEQTKPTEPVVNEPSPVAAEEAAPVTEEEPVVEEEAAPAEEETVPVAEEETVPVAAEEAAPAAEETAPTTEEAAPAEQETVPVAEEEPVVEEEAAPAEEEAAPAEETENADDSEIVLVVEDKEGSEAELTSISDSTLGLNDKVQTMPKVSSPVANATPNVIRGKRLVMGPGKDRVNALKAMAAARAGISPSGIASVTVNPVVEAKEEEVVESKEEEAVVEAVVEAKEEEAVVEAVVEAKEEEAVAEAVVESKEEEAVVEPVVETKDEEVTVVEAVVESKEEDVVEAKEEEATEVEPVVEPVVESNEEDVVESKEEEATEVEPVVEPVVEAKEEETAVSQVALRNLSKAKNVKIIQYASGKTEVVQLQPAEQEVAKPVETPTPIHQAPIVPAIPSPMDRLPQRVQVNMGMGLGRRGAVRRRGQGMMIGMLRK